MQNIKNQTRASNPKTCMLDPIASKLLKEAFSLISEPLLNCQLFTLFRRRRKNI